MAIRTISQWQKGDRHYTLTPSTFTKRELPHEKRRRPDGPIVTLPQSRERLENERDALLFIANNSKIPVPKVLDFTTKDGIASLTIEAIAGDTVFDLGPTLNGEDKAMLMRNVNDFLHTTVLPQLHSLRSRTLGALRGIVIPAERVSERDKRTAWQKGTECFVFCYYDLAPQNIFVDPKSLRVVALLDWEYSGYFEAEFDVRFFFKQFWETC